MKQKLTRWYTGKFNSKFQRRNKEFLLIDIILKIYHALFFSQCLCVLINMFLMFDSSSFTEERNTDKLKVNRIPCQLSKKKILKNLVKLFFRYATLLQWQNLIISITVNKINILLGKFNIV